MNPLVWFLSEAAMPLSIGAAFGLALDVARRGPRVRHYRWRNRRFLRQVRAIELRDRARRGGPGEETGSNLPRPLPVPAGGEARPPRPVDAVLPPAPLPLVGAVTPEPASTRPPLVRLGGGL
jgi:hypothetical protein